MARFQWMKSGAATALAAALAIGSIAPSASAQDGNGRPAWSHGGDDNRGDGQRRGGGRAGWGRDGNDRGGVRAQTETTEQRGRAWGNSDNSPRQDWRSQRAPGNDTRAAQETTRDWRTRDYREATREPRRDDRQSGWRSTDPRPDRNRTYSDPTRDGSYRARQEQQTRHYRDSQWSNDGPTYRDSTRQRGWDGSRWNGGDARRWNRDWRRDNRYDWRSYRDRHRDSYRIGRYYSPYRSYSYSRLSIGFMLDSLFYGRNYWISDPWQYRLPDVYGPYRWVRYYDDVLLVNIYSGEVVDVIHDFFW